VVLRRQSEHLADDRERQVSAKLGHKIGLVSSFQSIEKPVGDGGYCRLEGLDRAALKRLVDEAPKPTMLGIVVPKHVQGQEPDGSRQESQDSGLRPDPALAGSRAKVS
jgi:hypothetical protein